MTEETIISSGRSFERKAGIWLGLSILLLSIIYLATTLEDLSWVRWIAVFFGFLVVLILIIEGGIFNYFAQKGYQSISFSDIVIWLTLITATLIFVNTSLLIPVLQSKAPEWLISITRTSGVILGSMGILLGIIYMISGFFKR